MVISSQRISVSPKVKTYTTDIGKVLDDPVISDCLPDKFHCTMIRLAGFAGR